MPDLFSPEFAALKQRAMQLSVEDIYTLLSLVGISFASRINPDQPASFEEIKDLPKDMLLDPLDEANSKQAVERFLQEKGV